MTSRTAALRYARAMFDVALNESADVQQVGRDLTAFTEVVQGHDALARALANPVVPASQKRAVIEQLLALAGPMSPIVAKTLMLLADRDRLQMLPDVDRGYQERLMQHAKVVRAEVVTAAPLPGDRAQALTDGLARATGRSVRLEARVDPSIIGGAVTRVGSTVYDGSVATQLQKLKQELVSAE